MSKLVTASFALSALLSGEFSPAQDPGSSAARQALILEAENAERDRVETIEKLLESLEIPGRVLDPLLVKREVVFLVGRPLIELKIQELIMEEWMERMIQDEGKKPEDFAVSDEAIESEVRENLSGFALNYPELDFWQVVRAQTGISKEQYLQQRRASLMFEKVFTPGAPSNWPAITEEAIKSSSGQTGAGANFWDSLVKEVPPDAADRTAGNNFQDQMLMQMLIRQLKEWSDIKYPSDGLPSSVALRVGGRDWLTEDAFNSVKSGMFLQDLETAIGEILIQEVLKQELIAEGSYLTDEEFGASYAEFHARYEGSLFSPEFVALQLMGFPSLEVFRGRHRLLKSFEGLIDRDYNDEILQAHADKYARFFGDGRVDVDLITFQGKDYRSGVWLPNGMETARERATECYESILKGERTFQQALDTMGEYFPADAVRGRITDKTMNELRRTLFESEYTDLQAGFSLGRFIFYDAEVGKVIGPIKGTSAWYVLRVSAKSPSKSATTVTDVSIRELIAQDYLNHRFLEWGRDVLKKRLK